jgi:hypothetical protein
LNNRRGIRIIESREFTKVVDAVGLLAGSKNWNEADQFGMEQWFGAYLTWLQTSTPVQGLWKYSLLRTVLEASEAR